MTDYLISVVIPTYNREKTIKRCIDSIVSQTYPVYEIIIVDDGSTDKTVSIVEKEYQDQRIRIIRQNHKGAQAARNVGIRAAGGKYIAFLDSDDEWLPNKLELQIKELVKDEKAVVCGGYLQADWRMNDSVDRHHLKKRPGKVIRKMTIMNGKSGNVYQAVLRQSFCMFQALLTSKSNLMEIGLLDENVPSFQEWDTAIRLAKNHPIAYVRKPLFIYHVYDGETISRNMRKDIDGRAYILEKYKFEIMNQLGVSGLTEKYRLILEKCIEYKDKRVFKYLIKYVLGKLHIFVLK